MDTAAFPRRPFPRAPRRGGRALLGATALAAALLLAGCGGGGDLSIDGGPAFNVGIVVGNTPFNPVFAGQVLDVSAAVGQDIEFDANEPVVWSFSVNGSPLFANGTTVDVGGVLITQQQFDPSRVILQSQFDGGPAFLPVDVVLTATSTIDAAQVVTVHLRLG